MALVGGYAAVALGDQPVPVPRIAPAAHAGDGDRNEGGLPTGHVFAGDQESSIEVLHRIERVVRSQAGATVGAGPDEPRQASALVVKQEFGTWIGLAERVGVKLPEDFVLPSDLHDAFAQANAKYSKALEAIEAVRTPIMWGLVERRLATRQYEEYPTPKSPEERKALREAKKPRTPNQAVIVSGNGQWVRLIRIDEGEDASLPALYQALDDVRQEYVDSVHMLLWPYLNR